MGHYYVDTENQINRLVKEWREFGKIVIAYDFDNTVFDYHGEGHDYSEVIDLLKRCRDYGAYFIVFTAAEVARYDSILSYLSDRGIPVDVINDNVPSVPFVLENVGQKVYYNVLLDDRAGLGQSCEVLSSALDMMLRS